MGKRNLIVMGLICLVVVGSSIGTYANGNDNNSERKLMVPLTAAIQMVQMEKIQEIEQMVPLTAAIQTVQMEKIQEIEQLVPLTVAIQTIKMEEISELESKKAMGLVEITE